MSKRWADELIPDQPEWVRDLIEVEIGRRNAENARLRRLLRRSRMYVPGDVHVDGEFLWDAIDAALTGATDQPTACLHEWEQQDFYLLCRKCEATMDVELTTVPTPAAQPSASLPPLSDDALVRMAVAAGFQDEQWPALFFAQGQYEISCPTVELRKFVGLVRAANPTDAVRRDRLEEAERQLLALAWNTDTVQDLAKAKADARKFMANADPTDALPHTRIEDCPTFFDGCNCTTDPTPAAQPNAVLPNWLMPMLGAIREYWVTRNGKESICVGALDQIVVAIESGPTDEFLQRLADPTPAFMTNAEAEKVLRAADVCPHGKPWDDCPDCRH